MQNTIKIDQCPQTSLFDVCQKFKSSITTRQQGAAKHAAICNYRVLQCISRSYIRLLAGGWAPFINCRLFCCTLFLSPLSSSLPAACSISFLSQICLHRIHPPSLWKKENSCKFYHQMAPHALVPNLATRWRHFHLQGCVNMHCHIALNCPIGIMSQYSLSRVTSVKSTKGVGLSFRHRPIDRTPSIPGADKNIQLQMCWVWLFQQKIKHPVSQIKTFQMLVVCIAGQACGQLGIIAFYPALLEPRRTHQTATTAHPGALRHPPPIELFY